MASAWGQIAAGLTHQHGWLAWGDMAEIYGWQEQWNSEEFYPNLVLNTGHLMLMFKQG